MDINELAREGGAPVRMVRYLISEGYIDPPKVKAGNKKAATYENRHLDQLRLYLHLRDAGLSQKEITGRKITKNSASKVLKGLNEVVRHRIVPGIELKVTASLVPADADAGEITQRILGILSVLGVRTKRKGHVDAERNDD